jgi:hypothetical protein
MLWENLTTIKYKYNIKYSGEENRYKRRTYLCTKLWNSDLGKAASMLVLLRKSKRYDKVKLHKNCVYAPRRLESG